MSKFVPVVVALIVHTNLAKEAETQLHSVQTYKGLFVVQCVPYERLQSMLKTVFGVEMSQGTISKIIQKAEKKAEPAIALIKEYISNSPVVGFDESGCYCNKRLDWPWIAQTVYHTLVFRANGRSGQILEEMFGDALKNMIAVTDRHSAYFALNFLSHQICLAHILRETAYLNEIDEKQQWSGELQSLLQEAIHKRNQHPDKVIDTSSWLTKMQVIPNLESETITDIAGEQLEPSVKLTTDDSTSYIKFDECVASHLAVTADKNTIKVFLPWVHIAISNARRLLLDVHHKLNPHCSS